MAGCIGPKYRRCKAAGHGAIHPAQTLEELREVARVMLQIRKENGEPLPPEITANRNSEGSMTVTA